MEILKSICKTLVPIFFYYMFSISITFYNKRIINFYNFPLLITYLHTFTKFILTLVYRRIFLKSSSRSAKNIEWKLYLFHVSLCGIAAALDIGLSNWSFEFITISLYTMTKSTCIIFIAIFSVIFKIEKKRPAIFIVATLIAVGLFCFSYSSTNFNLYGFFLVLIASLLSGVRWTIVQLLLQKESLSGLDPLELLFYLQPWMSLTIFPIGFAIENELLICYRQLFRAESYQILITSSLSLLLGAFIAFGLDLSEFTVVKLHSSLTFSVSSIIKEIFLIVVSSLMNGDRLTPLNIIGFVLCIAGTSVHVYDRWNRHQDSKPNYALLSNFEDAGNGPQKNLSTDCDNQE